MLQNVHKYNERLHALLAKSEKVASFRKSNLALSPPRAVRSLLQYWQHADRLYTFIHHSWGCQCKQKHCAHLWLQHRTSPKFEFKLLLLWAPKIFPGPQFPPWDRQGLSSTMGTVSDQLSLPRWQSKKARSIHKVGASIVLRVVRSDVWPSLASGMFEIHQQSVSAANRIQDELSTTLEFKSRIIATCSCLRHRSAKRGRRRDRSRALSAL